MINGIKILNLGIKPEKLLENDLLDFPLAVSGDTAKIKTIENKINP